MKRFNKAFTLAEILIVLAIIGVVAAMTLPTLVTKINDKVKDNQAKVFNAKLIKGLNLTKTAGDLNSTYSSTYDFLTNGLAKNYKMVKICDYNKISECIPYNEIKYEVNNKEKNIKISEIKTAGNLMLNGGFKDVAAFVSADGIPVILSYNLNCEVDFDEADKNISGCIAGLYDINGSRKPNKFFTKIENRNGKTINILSDVRSINGANLGHCISAINGACLASTAQSAAQALNAIKAIDENYQQPIYTYNGVDRNDYWKLAYDYCDKVVPGSHLPSKAELKKIGEALYGIEFVDDGYKSTPLTAEALANAYKNKGAVEAALGINLPPGFGGFALSIWLDENNLPSDSDAWYGHFRGDFIGYDHYYGRNNSGIYTICMGE